MRRSDRGGKNDYCSPEIYSSSSSWLASFFASSSFKRLNKMCFFDILSAFAPSHKGRYGMQAVGRPVGWSATVDRWLQHKGAWLGGFFFLSWTKSRKFIGVSKHVSAIKEPGEKTDDELLDDSTILPRWALFWRMAVKWFHENYSNI